MKKATIGLLTFLALGFGFYRSFAFGNESGQASSSAAPKSVPKAVVVVEVRPPDFTVTNLKGQVVVGQAKKDHIPLNGYDFKASLTDELLNDLSKDKRMQWQAATDSDRVNAKPLFDEQKANGLASLDADLILLVDVVDYGAWITSFQKNPLLAGGLGPLLNKVGSKRQCFIMAKMKLMDRASGKILWEKIDSDFNSKSTQKIPLPKEIDELQTDNQKGLKEVLNQTIEKFCAKRAEELRGKKLKN